MPSCLKSKLLRVDSVQKIGERTATVSEKSCWVYKECLIVFPALALHENHAISLVTGKFYPGFLVWFYFILAFILTFRVIFSGDWGTLALCSGLIPCGYKGTQGMLGIELRFFTCKASALTTVLSIWTLYLGFLGDPLFRGPLLAYYSYIHLYSLLQKTQQKGQ